MDRRKFLENMSLLSGSFVLAGLPTKAWSSPLLRSLEGTDDKILVIIQLSGGNDGFNTVVPIEDSLYYSKRPRLAIPKDKTLKISSNIGFHPNLTGFEQLYKEGKMSLVQGVGYQNPDRSHFRSTDIWLSSSDSDEFLSDGWAGRYLSLKYPNFPLQSPEHPMAVQLGSSESALLHSHAGSMGLVFESPNAFYQLVAGSQADNDAPPNTLAGDELKFLKQIASQSIQYRDVVKSTGEKGKNLLTYPNSRLGQQLSIVGKLINGGLQSSVYLTTLGGFDTHANQADAHGNLLKQLGDAVLAFEQDMEKMGYGERVSVMTFSEFGRRLNENGSLGTDHGTAAPMFVFGKSVKGGLVGKTPDLSKLDSTGDIIFENDYRQIYASILQDHLGMNGSQIKEILGQEYKILPIYRSNITASNPDLEFELKQNFPNPFNNATTIQYILKKSSQVKLSLVDMTGRQVSVLAEGMQSDGAYEVTFNGTDYAAGLYLCVLEVNGRRNSKRMVLAK